MGLDWSTPMARKQETPASTADVKGTDSTSESSGVQPDGSASVLSPDAPLAPDHGEAGSVASGQAASKSPEHPEGQAGSGPESATEGLGSVTSHPGGSSPLDAPAGLVGEGRNQLLAEEQVAANPNPVALQVYPMRSYMDEGELRRRGGPAYSAPRRHAEELVNRKLASFEPLKE